MGKLLTWAGREIRRNGRNLLLVGMSTLAVSASLRALQVKKMWEPQVEARQLELDATRKDLAATRERLQKYKTYTVEEFTRLESEVGRGARDKVKEARERLDERMSGGRSVTVQAAEGEAAASKIGEPAMKSI